MGKQMIILAADHAGFALKERLKQRLTTEGHRVEDLTPNFVPEDDYPAPAVAVARRIAKDRTTRGILICGSGVGMAMAANRIKGARAFEADTEKTVRLARQDNDANIITLSGWRLPLTQAKKLVDLFLRQRRSNAVRHQRRIKQLDHA